MKFCAHCGGILDDEADPLKMRECIEADANVRDGALEAHRKATNWRNQWNTQS